MASFVMHEPAVGLTAEKIHVWRGDRHVLRGVSFAAGPGCLLHVHGPNGTGKTTLLRVLCGLLRPESGVVRWGGQAIETNRGDYQRAMTYASHEAALKGDLTALENLRYAVGLKRRVTDGELRATLERTGVAPCADLPARVLGMHARLWLLDEPYTNLDAKGALLLTELLDAHVGAGGIALVVAHHALPLSGAVDRLELAA